MKHSEDLLLAARAGYVAQAAQIAERIAGIDRELRGNKGRKGRQGRKSRKSRKTSPARKISAEGILAIQRAQRKRWALIKAAARAKASKAPRKRPSKAKGPKAVPAVANVA